MFPLLLLSAFAGYSFGKNQSKDKIVPVYSDNSEDTSKAKAVNTYNYYTNESENGNTLFGSQKKTKRTLFGNDSEVV